MKAKAGRFCATVFTLLGVAACGLDCGGAKAEAAPPGISTVPTRAAGSFAFESLDARAVSSAAFAGKPLVIVFITTWDLASQAQMRFLAEMDKRDQGKVGYAAVCLQESKERELIEVYRSTLDIRFPVAIAEQGTLAGSAFGDVQTVPTVLVLDGLGHVRFQKVGVAHSDELRSALRGL